MDLSIGLFFVMPYSYPDKVPAVAKNWTAEEQKKCTVAAGAALAKGASEQDAIFACIGAAGKSEKSNEMTVSFLVPTEDSAENGTLIFPIGAFYRGGKKREFTIEDANTMVHNFKTKVLGPDRLPPVNREHKREAGKIGNIVDLWVSTDGVRGTVEGEMKGFDYISPEVRWEWTNPYTGDKHKNVLMGAGATNYPFFLSQMQLNNEAGLLWTGSDWESVDSDSDSDGGSMPSGGLDTNSRNRQEGTMELEELQTQLDEFTAKLETAGTELAASNEALVAAGVELVAANARVETLEKMIAAAKTADKTPEPASDKDSDDELPAEFTDKVKEMEEDFTAKLAAITEDREKFSELYEKERQTRRLSEFSDTAKGFSFATEVEEFAQDLMLIEDADPELYGRWVTRLEAIAAQVESGELFAQNTVAGGDSDQTDPFEREIERVRVERFGTDSYETGWTQAMTIVQRDSPDLARRYAAK